ncbi:MAG: hypothetical protein GF398_02735 [Chitinivibrionales bacterium]|nr:hypothetical protein [Chitinivibrionales bacterium]
MPDLLYRYIREGAGPRPYTPLHIALVDRENIDACGIGQDDAICAVAADVNAPVAINIFDMQTATTTSDGLVVQGAIVRMGAGDNGVVHKEFGILSMACMEVTDELIEQEPHLAQVNHFFPGRKLYRGPDPAEKLIPIHNVVMTGRAVNNNSATEMMNVITMEEILFPILGQLQLMHDKPVLCGMSGQYLSVGVGMTVAEKFGRIFPTRQFPAGDTAHASGGYAKTLKSHIPCIVAPKPVLARCILRALDAGMVAGREIGCAPAVLAVSRAYGAEIAIDNITPKAREELLSLGIDVCAESTALRLSAEEIVARADQLIPGVDDAVLMQPEDIMEHRTVSI